MASASYVADLRHSLLRENQWSPVMQTSPSPLGFGTQLIQT